MSAEEEQRGVTEITHIEIFTDVEILARNHENWRQYHIPPKVSAERPGRVNVNWWIPWCTNASDHAAGEYIAIGLSPAFYDRKFTIWQRDVDWTDRVRWTNSHSWDRGALPMPGDSHVNGRRILKIYKLDGPATEENDERAELVE